MNLKLNRVDFTQVGLTSKNALVVLEPGFIESDGDVIAAIGDHSGSVECFSIREQSFNCDTIFKTLPGPNAKISCMQLISSGSGTTKILSSFGSSTIRGFTKSGKQFFGVELNDLTEPIKHFRFRWQNELFVCDRLIRILKDSTCQYEIEACGVPCAVYNYTSAPVKNNSEIFFVYGTLDGKVSLIELDFSQSTLDAKHIWEVPERGTRAPVQCISAMESTGELYIGRADGNIEIWIFSENCDADGNDYVDLKSAPMFRTHYSCGESITSVCVCRDGTLLLCSTFTGIVFGLTRSENIHHTMNSSFSKGEFAEKIENLRIECEELETKLAEEKERYQELTTKRNRKGQARAGISALPYFVVNDTFIIQEDASYLLTLEVEVPIDCVIIQSDIPLDLIDCERNSAVVSFNDNCDNEVIATFRCQSNTTRLEVKIGSIEGQFGILRAYIIPRMTPKSCQVKQYQIKALSLHKRSYNISDADTKTFFNKLSLKGGFSFNQAHNWLQLCLPEIPEKLLPTNVSSVDYSFVSTLTDSLLLCHYAKGSLLFESDNISTISILKDFITREATKRSIALEMNLNINEGSVSLTLRKLHPKLKGLLKLKERNLFIEAIKELSVTDAEVANAMMEDLNRIPIEQNISTMSLDRIYGLITDLYIDYNKLKGNTSRSAIASVKNKIGELVKLIETYASDQYNADIFVEKFSPV
ncbi:hypothetical protein B4U79_07615 [Dinothrombium tinctorium]|uniref:Bardet-Biedl syndrome 7 protein-like protein n=1 Tax=Dinothrombium tinctorium TaxID=1965070 RepID=A0A3S3QZD1_9ACAR|nr:hypothetical protein B4U79_07615 [Dinothrombium tinctorium]